MYISYTEYIYIYILCMNICDIISYIYDLMMAVVNPTTLGRHEGGRGHRGREDGRIDLQALEGRATDRSVMLVGSSSDP